MKVTKSFNGIFAAAAIFLSVGALQAATTWFQLASDVGAQIEFNGSTFSFTSTGTGPLGPLNDNFFVESVYDSVHPGTGPIGDVGWFGSVTGPWTIGTITTTGNVESAPIVSPAGTTINIYDGANTWSGNLSWGTIYTTLTTGGVKNDNVTLNIGSITYSGSVQQFKDLGLAAGLTLSFSFAPPTGVIPLDQLVTGGPHYLTWSASLIDQVPEPTTLVAGLGALGLALFGLRSRRSSRK